MDLGVPLPRPFQVTAEIILNQQLRLAFLAPELDLLAIKSLLEEAHLLQVALEGTGLEFALRKAIERLAERFQQHPSDLTCLQQLEAAVSLGTELPFAVNFLKVQNIYYEMLNSIYPHWRQRSEQGDEVAQAWVEHFVALGRELLVSIL
jgi:hypothetical protein